MAPGINITNEGSWGALGISILESGLLMTVGLIMRLEINLTDRKTTMLLLIMQWTESFRKKKLSAEEEAHDNIESEIN